MRKGNSNYLIASWVDVMLAIFPIVVLIFFVVKFGFTNAKLRERIKIYEEKCVLYQNNDIMEQKE